MIRRMVLALLNGLIAVLETLVDDKENRREYWLIAPLPSAKEFPPVEDSLDFARWETEDPGGETW